MPPRLILNADDFGLTTGINRAILELHRAGVVTSATLMATGPAFDEAAAIAIANPTLGVGCHLVFADGIPISHPDSIPTLLGADGKTFRPSSFDFLQAALRGTIRAEDVARETQAQIQKLQRAGIDVTHIDTHKHTHLLPVIARTIVHIAGRCGISSIRNPIEPRWSSTLAHAALFRRLGLRVMERFGPSFDKLTQTARIDGLVTEGTLGIAVTGILDPSKLRAILDRLLGAHPESTHELLCHPGYNDADLDAQQTRLRSSREVEYQALLEVIPEYSRNPERLSLIHYGNLGVPGLQRASGQYVRPTGYERVL
jgi:chitin disaccharide deacetylase